MINSLLWKISHLIPAQKAMQVSLGIIFLWFGLPKFFPGFSSAEGLIFEAFEGIIPVREFIYSLAVIETLMGIGMIYGKRMKFLSTFMLGHMGGTFLTIFLVPELIFSSKGWGLVLTLEGQYVIKNIIIVAICLMILSENIREVKRHIFRTTGFIKGQTLSYLIQTKDISEQAISFYIINQEVQEFKKDYEFSVNLNLPLEETNKEINLKMTILKATSHHKIIEVVAQFQEPDQAKHLLRHYMNKDLFHKMRHLELVESKDAA